MSPEAIETTKTLASIVGAFAAMLAGMWAVITRPIQAQIQLLSTNMDARFGEVNKSLDKINSKLESHGERITKLEVKR